MLGSAASLCAVGAILVLLSRPAAGGVVEEPVVDVKFFQRPAPPPPPLAARRDPAPARPRVETPKKPTAPVPLIQPKELPSAIPSPPPAESEDDDAGSDEGSPAGAPGGVPDGVVGGVAGSIGTRGGGGDGPGTGIEEAPRYVTGDLKKPSEAQPGCVRNAIHLPTQLVGFVSGPVTVKFAVGRDGSVALVQLMTPVPDRRIEDAIRAGLMACRWVPGADGQGHPLRLWVIMPIRFTTG